MLCNGHKELNMLCQLSDIECDVSGEMGGSEEEVVVACLKVLSC